MENVGPLDGLLPENGSPGDDPRERPRLAGSQSGISSPTPLTTTSPIRCLSASGGGEALARPRRSCWPWGVVE